MAFRHKFTGISLFYNKIKKTLRSFRFFPILRIGFEGGVFP